MSTYIKMAVYGAISTFNDEEEDWANYVERIKCFFTANDIDAADKKRAIFLSVVGAKSYAILRGLSGNNPTSKSFDELDTLMQLHLHPAPTKSINDFFSIPG